jgi:hypothetical protein
MTAAPVAPAEASSLAVSPGKLAVAPAGFFTDMVCPRDDAMSTGPTAAYFVLATFFALEALVAGAPRAGTTFFRTFCLALQESTMSFPIVQQITNG